MKYRTPRYGEGTERRAALNDVVGTVNATGIQRTHERIGVVFGRLVTVAFAKDGSISHMSCRCSCGRDVVVKWNVLASGNTRSCGCLRRDTSTVVGGWRRTHGKTNTTEFRTWMGMRKRCTDPNDYNYQRWGGRGITVCDRWMNSFENFLSDMGKRPRGTTLDRIDNDGPYSPENCRWATNKQQARNRSSCRMETAFGETKTVADWMEDPRCKCNRTAIEKRFRLGWDFVRALTTPMKADKRRHLHDGLTEYRLEGKA